MRINLDAPVAHLNVTLQRMLNVLRFLEAGSLAVTPDLLAESQHFFSFYPAAGHALDLDEARTVSQGWLNNAFLRDAIEATGIFIDEYLVICALLSLSSPKTFDELRKEYRRRASAAQRLHFPQKVQTLVDELGATPAFSDYVLSLNKARTCLVHRMGRVSSRDTNQDDSLVIKFRSMQLVVVDDKSGNEKILDKPNSWIEGGSRVELRLRDYTQTFAIGQTIALSSHDLHSIIMTLWAYAGTCQAATKTLAQRRDVPIDTPPARDVSGAETASE